jgi:hypothetical protein
MTDVGSITAFLDLDSDKETYTAAYRGKTVYEGPSMDLAFEALNAALGSDETYVVRQFAAGRDRERLGAVAEELQAKLHVVQ